MKKVVPLNNKSKRFQKEFYSKQRGSWYGVNPVTRVVPNGKGYDRNQMKRENRCDYEK